MEGSRKYSVIQNGEMINSLKNKRLNGQKNDKKIDIIFKYFNNY